MDDHDTNGVEHEPLPSKTEPKTSPFIDVDDDIPAPQSGMHQSVSGIDVTGAVISQEWSYISPDNDDDGSTSSSSYRRRKDAPSILLPHQSEYISHIALDIGGSLIKLVYFSRDPLTLTRGGGKLHFVKFETAKVEECIDFIEAKGLHRRNGSTMPMRVKATGGGAFKYADIFRERLGLILEREDEMACMVEGCNFLLKAVGNEAFTYEQGQMSFIHMDPESTYPYLLVNIGSGVSMVRVDGEGRHHRVSGTNIGGGTFWGLCRLLTGYTSFDDILKLSSEGDNSQVDMLVGDIYGGRDYSSIGLSANTIASSFGKVIYGDKELSDYSKADIAMSLCRMISYNIGQLAYLNAKRYNLPRIFFGGFFIRGHPYTMETISFAIRFWSKGEMGAMFLRHEGFLGAVGAFMRVQAVAPLPEAAAGAGSEAGKVRARVVERFSMGAPVFGGEVRGPVMHDVNDKIKWMDKFIAVGKPATEAARSEHERAIAEQTALFRSRSHTAGEISEASLAAAFPASVAATPKINLDVGVLHFTPTQEPFPLLSNPSKYDPNTIDINADAAEMAYWVGVLQDQIPTVVEKAAASENNEPEAVRRATAFGRAFDLHLTKLRSEPGAYGQLGLADLFELREECLREFGFADVYKLDKERENAAALEVLPDLLSELDELPHPARLLALIQGVLAANIFDWGAKACVDLYYNATILEMYREARTKLSQRPWRVDDLDEFAEVWLGRSDLNEQGQGKLKIPYKRAILFVDNAGADVVLGMLPFARELLRAGCEVVLVANSLPAINDITADELCSVVAKAAEVCPIIKAARDAAVAAEAASQGRVPPLPGLSQRPPSMDNLAKLVIRDDDEGGNGRRSVRGSSNGSNSMMPVARTAAGFASASPINSPSSTRIDTIGVNTTTTTTNNSNTTATMKHVHFNDTHVDNEQGDTSNTTITATTTNTTTTSPTTSPSMPMSPLGRRPSSLASKGMFGESYPSPWREPRLYVIPSGSGSPCLDLRRVSGDVADATVGTDLVVIEGMGRAIHTNFRTKLSCDVLKLAMIKNQHLARSLFGGNVYDCVCRFDEA